ncbi:MAG TPA: hypothetical protein VIY50_10905 [Steroidobacteraceae bacterium]
MRVGCSLRARAAPAELWPLVAAEWVSVSVLEVEAAAWLPSQQGAR